MRHLMLIIALLITLNGFGQVDAPTPTPDSIHTTTVENLMQQQQAKQDSMRAVQQRMLQAQGDSAIQEVTKKTMALTEESKTKDDQPIAIYVLIGLVVIAAVVFIVIRNRKRDDTQV